MKILVTGGTGYIGSHTVLELLRANYEVVIIDNLSNSKIDVLEKIENITSKRPKFYKEDVCNKDEMDKIFKKERFDAVIHFAGLKAVGESVIKPIEYYRNNLDSTLTLLEIMKKYNCKKLVFSSSATVYGKPEKLPIEEHFSLKTTNPYGTTKLMIEMILNDLYISDPSWSIAILRYFNPIGADPSGLLGEDPNGIPNNLLPFISKVAVGDLEELKVFGSDYDTVDGTGVRDYIHVVDLSKGHLKALDKIFKDTKIDAYNLGTGEGYSVLQIIKSYEKVNKVKIPYEIVDRRPGDIDSCYASTKKALKELNWKSELTIDDMCRDAYNFVKNNK